MKLKKNDNHINCIAYVIYYLAWLPSKYQEYLVEKQRFHEACYCASASYRLR